MATVRCFILVKSHLISLFDYCILLLFSMVWVETPCEATAPGVTATPAFRRPWGRNFWLPRSVNSFKASPEMCCLYLFSSRGCHHGSQADSCSCSQVTIAGSHEVSTIFCCYFFHFRQALCYVGCRFTRSNAAGVEHLEVFQAFLYQGSYHQVAELDEAGQ
jgi:hypothetical protein